MKKTFKIAMATSMLLLAGLACQTGEILTPEEATQRAEATENPGGQVESVVEAQFQAGDEVRFVATNFLIPLAEEPGDPLAVSHVGRGETGTVQGSEVVDETLWYRVATGGGEGWVKAENVSRAVAEGEDGGSVQVGDRVYLTAPGFLVNFYQEPGSNRIVAGQERGVLVEIKAIETVDGTNWYEIEAPTGTGWVPEANISTEDPSPGS